jgi:hypothetical protein
MAGRLFACISQQGAGGVKDLANPNDRKNRGLLSFSCSMLVMKL